jgi:hypothetical protein
MLPIRRILRRYATGPLNTVADIARQGQAEMSTMRRASLRRACLNMRMRMGRGAGSKNTIAKTETDASFYFTTEAVKTIESKEDTSLTAMCQVGGHDDCNKSILA